MNINVKVDAAPLLLRMRKGEKRLAYAVVNALNNTAKRVQAKVNEHVRSHFTIRKPEFFFGTPGRPGGVAAKIDFANVKKAKPFAEISIPQRKRLFLSTFESGGARPTVEGRKGAAAPVIGSAARPTFGQTVPAQLRFSALRLRKTRLLATVPATSGVSAPRKRKRSKVGAGVRYGLQGTYQIDDVGVFQDPPGPEESHLIFAFTQGQQLEDTIDWVGTATAEAQAWFGEEMEREVVKALEHDAGRSF